MNGAAYFTIVNRGGEADALVGASSPLAASVSLHRSMMVHGVMLMRPLAEAPVPAKGELTFAPGGLHLMMEGLKRPLREGERAPVILKFRRSGARRVELVVGQGPPA